MRTTTRARAARRVGIAAQRILVLASLAMAGACASGPTASRASALLPRGPADAGHCRATAYASPLLTEWPASEKANLEMLLRGGGVAVTYAGCSLRVLPACRVQGGYQWIRTTPSTDSLEISDTDDLFSKLPIGAATLEAELKRSGHLSVETVIAGQLRLEGSDVGMVAQDPACAQATHVVSSLSLGAFAMKAGGTREGGGGATVFSVGLGGKREQSAELLRSAGTFDACLASTEQGPSANCASPIQAFLAPIPGRVEQEGPAGTVKVDFVSANPSSRWDVYADDRVICTTPCAGWVSAERPVMLRARDEAFMAAPDRVRVANFLSYANDGPLQLQAHPTARGKLASGIVFTTFSGMTALTGVALGSVGCLADKGDGLCKAGLITMGVGLPALAASIWLITESMPKAEVAPLYQGERMYVDGDEAGLRLSWGPGFVSGTF